MVVYCEERTDEDLLLDIGEAARVLLVGCPACANLSCAVRQQEDAPFMKIGVTGVKALLLSAEMNRTAELLRQKGMSVDSWIPSGIPASCCALNDPSRKKLFDRTQDRDVVLCSLANQARRAWRTSCRTRGWWARCMPRDC